MRNPLPAALVALLLLASAARADSLLDKPAPDPVAASWVGGTAPPAWKALEGRCALLELLDPDDIVSQGLVSRTVEIAARAVERKIVLVSVAVGTGADEAKAAKFAKEFKVTWPLAVDRKGETFFAAGNPTLPHYLLIAPDGRVMWEGSPGALDEKTLDGFIERARLWRPADVAKTQRPAAEAFTRGKYGPAEKKAAEAVVEFDKRTRAGLPVDGNEAKDAALIRDAVRDLATIRLAIADRLAKARLSLDAQEILEAMVVSFQGTEWEGKAKAALAALAADERAQAEITALRRVREIVAATHPLTRKSVQKAVEALDAWIALNEKYMFQATDRARAERARLAKMLE